MKRNDPAIDAARRRALQYMDSAFADEIFGVHNTYSPDIPLYTIGDGFEQPVGMDPFLEGIAAAQEIMNQTVLREIRIVDEWYDRFINAIGKEFVQISGNVWNAFGSIPVTKATDEDLETWGRFAHGVCAFSNGSMKPILFDWKWKPMFPGRLPIPHRPGAVAYSR